MSFDIGSAVMVLLAIHYAIRFEIVCFLDYVHFR
nr:MAG TPA: hypothetical protein [Caudoviricetes sp.]